MLSDAPSSFSQDAAAGAGESGKVIGGGMNPKKLREEIELAKTRLSDQKFRISKSLVPEAMFDNAFSTNINNS